VRPDPHLTHGGVGREGGQQVVKDGHGSSHSAHPS
jgi:hypothetical protein